MSIEFIDEGGGTSSAAPSPAALPGDTRLVLVGASGSGKTTVGALLARDGGPALVDVDDEVSRLLGHSLADLVVAADPRLPRTRQAVALAALAELSAQVGGGGILVLGASQVHDPQVARALAEARAAGVQVVELTTDIAEVSRRQGLNAPRSVALGAPRAMLTRMMAEHHQACLGLVDATVDTCGVPPVVVADRVIAACRLDGGHISPEQ